MLLLSTLWYRSKLVPFLFIPLLSLLLFSLNLSGKKKPKTTTTTTKTKSVDFGQTKPVMKQSLITLLLIAPV